MSTSVDANEIELTALSSSEMTERTLEDRANVRDIVKQKAVDDNIMVGQLLYGIAMNSAAIFFGTGTFRGPECASDLQTWLLVSGILYVPQMASIYLSFRIDQGLSKAGSTEKTSWAVLLHSKPLMVFNGIFWVFELAWFIAGVVMCFDAANISCKPAVQEFMKLYLLLNVLVGVPLTIAHFLIHKNVDQSLKSIAKNRAERFSEMSENERPTSPVLADATGSGVSFETFETQDV